MKRSYASLMSILLLTVGCQATQPSALSPAVSPSLQARASVGTLSVSIRWPRRTVQLIPLSTQNIRIQVQDQGGSVLNETIISRPPDNGGTLVAVVNLQVSAGSGLIVQVDAFRDEVIGDLSEPIARATSAPVTVTANQRTSLALTLAPVYSPGLTSFSPDNGGPGTPVTLVGDFGDSGYYAISLGGVQSPATSGSSTSISATIPHGVPSGPLTAWADGASASLGATFSVLTALVVTPSTRTTTVSALTSYAVPTGTDTTGQTIANPTITHWEVVDPLDLNATSSVGTIDASGAFTATQAGTAWVRAWSGNLQATATVTVTVN